MAFIKKTWLARLGTGLNKFTVNGGNKVALDSAPDTITQEGTPLSAQNMNDLEGRIETAFMGVDTDLTNLAGNFAQIETTPSTHNYAVGDMLVFNGILYKVITAIATNDALVVGSNIQAQTVGSAIMNITNITLLWTNPSPSSTFNAQKISVSLSGYKFVMILCKEYYDRNGEENCSFVPIIVEKGQLMVGRVSDAIFYRNFTLSDTGVTFDVGCVLSPTDVVTSSGYCIPLKIYAM